jgi:putative PIN family toxin of toxin-antitoxin system
MKKVIIDTNILISAILKGRVPRLVIQFIVDSLSYQWVVSAEILAEYKEVLSRKKLKVPDEIKNQWLELIDLATVLVDVKVEIDFPRDKKDAKFLECAVAAEADFLITGDTDFTEAQSLVDTPIVSVALFKKLICDIKE